MGIRYGFFSAYNNDRKYDGLDLGKMFDGVITDGVFANVGNALKVMPNGEDGNSVLVNTGKAWFYHTYIEVEDVPIKIPVDTGYAENYIVVEVNLKTRINNIKSVHSMVNSEYVRQYSLAKVVKNSNGLITGNDIEDYRGTTACPFITGPLQTISADEIITQWKSEFQDFLDGCDSKIEELTTNEVNKLWADLSSDIKTDWQMLHDDIYDEWNDYYDSIQSYFDGLQFSVNKQWTDMKNSIDVEWTDMKNSIDAEWEAVYEDNTRDMINARNEVLKTKDDVIEEINYAYDEFENFIKNLTLDYSTYVYNSEITDDQGELVTDESSNPISSIIYFITL